MSPTSHFRRGIYVFRTELASLLVVGLAVVAVGCGGAGANGGGSNGNDTTAPAAPTGLTGTSGDAEITLRWKAVGAEDRDAYRVYRGTESGVDTSGNPLESGLSATEYVDGSAENGTTYYYVVTAVDTAGNESGASNEVAKTPFSDPPDRP